MLQYYVLILMKVRGTGKMKKLIQQILKFGVVGFLCFFIDYGIMVALTELCGIPSVISSGISFSVSVIVNYILSITMVFDADKDANKVKQFVVFLILSIIGLGINQLIMLSLIHISEPTRPY